MAAEYILAIDFGERRVGLALAHQVARLPRPLKTIPNDDALFDAIAQTIQEEGVASIVVGLPRNMDGSLGFQAKAAEQFSTALSSQIQIPVTLVDETLSSVEAVEQVDARTLDEVGKDAVAAAVILERYLSTQGDRA